MTPEPSGTGKPGEGSIWKGRSKTDEMDEVIADWGRYEIRQWVDDGHLRRVLHERDKWL